MSSNVGPDPPGQYMYGLEKGNEDAVKGHASRTVESECQYMLPTLEKMLQANPHLRLLDVGCGPGSITVDFARRMPAGRVTGVDISDAVLGQARERAAAAGTGAANVTFVRGSAYALPFADGAFDVVHTHQAVAHFHDQVAAIRELLRVTRPGGGGVLCMREAVLPTAVFHPAHPLLHAWRELVCAVHEANGGKADAGLRLKALTVAAGVPRAHIDATAGSWCYSTPAQREAYGGTWPGRLTRGTFAERAVELGLCTKERLEEMAEAWRQWVRDEDGIHFMTHGQVIVRKP